MDASDHKQKQVPLGATGADLLHALEKIEAVLKRPVEGANIENAKRLAMYIARNSDAKNSNLAMKVMTALLAPRDATLDASLSVLRTALEEAVKVPGTD